MGCEGYCEAGTPRGELALKIGVAVVVGGGWTGLRGGAARGPHVGRTSTPVGLCANSCVHAHLHPAAGEVLSEFQKFLWPPKGNELLLPRKAGVLDCCLFFFNNSDFMIIWLISQKPLKSRQTM